MTLSEERELEMIRQGLSYVKSDAHSREPHWDAKYPLKIQVPCPTTEAQWKPRF